MIFSEIPTMEHYLKSVIGIVQEKMKTVETFEIKQKMNSVMCYMRKVL